jgi:hypothetical protein
MALLMELRRKVVAPISEEPPNTSLKTLLVPLSQASGWLR